VADCEAAHCSSLRASNLRHSENSASLHADVGVQYLTRSHHERPVGFRANLLVFEPFPSVVFRRSSTKEILVSGPEQDSMQRCASLRLHSCD
jgi:hypothetical protein